MQKVILLLFGIGLISMYLNSFEVDPLQDQPEYERFQEWCIKYHKTYSSSQERQYRYHMFIANLMRIRQFEQNRREDQIHMAENGFMDMDYSEFRQLMMKGRRKPKHGYRDEEEKIVYLNITDLPTNVDWRGKAISNVKNQGKCGGCWAFSTVGALEGAWARENEIVDMSEQQVIDCCRLNLYGCNGGDPIVALDECILRDGIMKSADYPFTGVTSRVCQWDDSKLVYTPSDYAIVPHNNSLQLQMALSLKPVAVCISDSAEFHFYSKGILEGEHCGIDNDHCIVAVGYGTENGKDYWILRNSWGPEWGEGGHIRVARHGDGAGACGVQQEGVYVIL